jgi:hypothetical protein
MKSLPVSVSNRTRSIDVDVKQRITEPSHTNTTRATLGKIAWTMVLLNQRDPVLQYDGGAHERERTEEMIGKIEMIVDQDMMLTTPKPTQQRPQIPDTNPASSLDLHRRTQSNHLILYRNMVAMLHRLDKRDLTPSPKDPTPIQILSINSVCQTQNQIREPRDPNDKSKEMITREAIARVARMTEDTARAKTYTIPGTENLSGLMQ